MSIAAVQGLFHCLVTSFAFSANRRRRNIRFSDCDFFVDRIIIAVTNQIVFGCFNFCLSAGTAALSFRFCLRSCLFSCCFLCRSFFISCFVSCGRFSSSLSSCLFCSCLCRSFFGCSFSGFSCRCLPRRFFDGVCSYFGCTFFNSCFLRTSSFRGSCFLYSSLRRCSCFGRLYFFCSIDADVGSCLLSCFFGCCHVPPYDDYASNDRKNKSGKNAPQNCSCRIPPVFNELT